MSGMLEKLVMLVVDDMEVNRRALRSIFEKLFINTVIGRFFCDMDIMGMAFL